MPGLNHILVIGIDPYDHVKYPTLYNASGDAQRIKKILEDVYHFEEAIPPILNENATRDNIIEALINLRSICTNEDNLIIYYAGHGLEDKASGNGIWVPIDAVHKDSRLIYDSELVHRIAAIDAKHIFLISDSCFSGKLFEQSRSSYPGVNYEELDNKKSRWIFYSGEQTVSDGIKDKGSPFCQAICLFLDSQKERIFSSGELIEFVRMTLKQQGRPMPGARYLHKNHENGQLVFRSNQLVEDTKVRGAYTKLLFPLPPSITTNPYLTRTVSEFDPDAKEIISFFRTEKERHSLLDTIQIQKRIVVLGTAGSGKSVELIELARQLQKDDNPFVPIFKRFNTYTGEAIEEYLYDGWQNVNPTSLVLLLDGLDEIQPIHFHTALRKITSFAEKNPLLTIIVSCRSNFYDLPKKNFSGALDGFGIYHINDISADEVIRYVDKHFNTSGDTFYEAARIAGIDTWILKPFFLGIVIDYFLKNRNLKGKRAEIMEFALENSYWNNKEHFKTTGPIALKEQAFSMLEKIAFVMELMGKNFLTDSELLTIYPEIIDQENCKYLPAFHRDNDKEYWIFEHNNIQEFLASRILSKEPFEKVIELISIQVGESRKIRPTWINTLSFLISIGEEELVHNLLNWILENDKEVLIRFEAGRLSTTQRADVFKKIFDDYNSKEVWVRSNKFTDEELCTFGYLPDVLEYLVTILENTDRPRIVRLNTVHILQHYILNDFPDFKERIKKALVQLLIHFDTDKVDFYGIQTILGTLGFMSFTDAVTTELIITRFKKRLNQHIRAGMYKFLVQSPFLDKYVDIFLEGVAISNIEDAIDDRESVNLMDEFLYLKIGLEQIKHPDALRKFMDYFGSEGSQKHLFLSDFKEIFTAIKENLVNVHQTDTKIFDDVLIFYQNLIKLFNRDLTRIISQFFDQTKTKWEALKTCWTLCHDMNTYQTSEYCEHLMDENTIRQLLEHISKGDTIEADILKLHELTEWNRLNIPDFDKLLPEVEAFAAQISIRLPERRVQNNWDEIQKQKMQIGFDTLLNRSLLEAEIKNVFTGMKSESLNSDDLYGLRQEVYTTLEDKYSVAALDALREQVFNRTVVTSEIMEEWLSNDSVVTNYVIRKVYEFLHGNNSSLITISENQQELVQKYCDQIELPDNIVWFFLIKYKIRFSEERLLKLTCYFDFNDNFDLTASGTLEQLEAFLTKQKVADKVLDNLQNSSMTPLLWVSNAAYALRNNLTTAFPLILAFLEKADEREYKLEELLKIWYKKTGDTSRLKLLIQNANSDELKFKGIKILIEAKLENMFLIDYLKKLMSESSRSLYYRIEAANKLLELGQLDGFYFIAKLILDNPTPNFDFERGLRNFKFITEHNAIDIFIQLLAIAKQTQFQDHFNSLEAKVMDAFYSIGTFSETNFLKVKAAFEKFIIDYKDKYEHLNFLHIRISDIEQKLTSEKSTKLNVQDALNVYYNL